MRVVRGRRGSQFTPWRKMIIDLAADAKMTKTTINLRRVVFKTIHLLPRGQMIKLVKNS